MSVELPLGFGMALAQNEGAMARFEALPQAEKERVLQRAHDVVSKQEMRALVESLVQVQMDG